MERKPAFFDLGSHDRKAIQELPDVLSKTSKILNNTRGSLVYVAEDGSGLPIVSDIIYKLTAQQYPPSLSFAMATYFLQHHELPELDTVFADFYEEKLESLDEFYRLELLTLDKLEEMYPGRVRLLMEKVTSEQFENPHHPFILKRQAIVNAAVYGFEYALPFYKSAVYALSDSYTQRESTLTGQINEASKDEDVSAFFIRIGTTHSPMRYGLHKEYSIQSHVHSEPNSIYNFQAFTVMARALRINPERQLSELEWYQGFIASIAEMSIRFKNGEDNEENPDSTIMAARNFTMQKIKSLDDVKWVESLLQSDGLDGLFQFVVKYQKS